MTVFETSRGFIKGEKIAIPLVAVVWTGSEKDGWLVNRDAHVLGLVSSMHDAQELLRANMLKPRERKLSTDFPQFINLPLSCDDQKWPAHVMVDAMSVVDPGA